MYAQLTRLLASVEQKAILDAPWGGIWQCECELYFHCKVDILYLGVGQVGGVAILDPTELELADANFWNT